MAFVLKDRVGEQVSTEGTGAITLTGVAMSGYQSITSTMADGDTSLYCVKDRSDVWNTFLGTYTAATRALARTVILDGSIGPGVAVSLTGAATVWVTQTASHDKRHLNVMDFGAVGDGVADDTVAIIAALASVPSAGGTVHIPAGHTFKFSSPLPAKSNTTITGGGTLKAAAIGAWSGTPYFGVINENHTALSITDSDITISGITIDYTDLPSADGTRHCIYVRKAERIRISGVTIIGGSSAVALLGCENTLEIGNTYDGFSNCGSDHWDQPNNTRVIGCHIKSAISGGQMMNYNPDPTSGVSTGFTAGNFVFSGNTVDASGYSATVACLVSPIGSDQTVRTFVISDNNFINSYVVIRGDTAFGVVTNNVFSGFVSGSEAITGYTRLTGTPASIVISGNVVLDPLTTAGNIGVIRMESDTSSVINNAVSGSSYGSLPFAAGTSSCQMFGNIRDDGGVSSGVLHAGFRLVNGLDAYVGWTDASGSVPRMFVQSDNNWIFHTTNSSGAQRVALSMYMRSSTSELIASVPMLFNSTTRSLAVTGIVCAGTTIGTATALTANYNEVSTAVAGVSDGVRLSTSNNLPQTVTNISGVTINVYPQNSGSGSIDGGAAAAPVTVLTGKSKTFFQYATNDYRTIGEF